MNYSKVPNKHALPYLFFVKKKFDPSSPRLLIFLFFRGKEYFCYKIQNFKTFIMCKQCFSFRIYVTASFEYWLQKFNES